MQNYKITNLKESKTVNSENQQEKQIELVFETSGRSETIKLAGTGALKVSTPV